jgi:hypothetical protein
MARRQPPALHCAESGIGMRHSAEQAFAALLLQVKVLNSSSHPNLLRFHTW